MTPRPEFPYVRLPGTLRGFMERASLWEGPDHLLSINGTRFSEEYRRFYYRDIEAIISRKCPRAGSLGVWIVSAIACLIALISAAKAPDSLVAWAIACSLIVFLGFRLALSLFYSCRCYVQTAVSREELPSLVRQRSADRALARLRKKVEEAQGILADDISETDRQQLTIGTPVKDLPSTNGNETRSSVGVKFAISAFILLLADATESFWFLDAPSSVAGRFGARLLTILLVLGEAGTIVPGVLSIHKSRTLRPVRDVLLASLVFVGLEVWFSLYFRDMYMAQAAAREVSFAQAWHWVQVVAGCVAVVLGVGGLILVLLKWETYRRGDLSTA
jgi:hypothetical protein